MRMYPILLLAVFHSAFSQTPKFRAQVVDANISIGYGMAIGDVDGDGKPDILLADKKQFVWYRNGDWQRFVMVENLTTHDNVCIAARDIDGDGKVEVAVGAQWNPSETSDSLQSGSVHYLLRPKNPTEKWTPLKLWHEPTVHRMRWVQVAPARFQLVVLPLHGRGNANGEGRGVKVIAYEMSKAPELPWKRYLIDESMHMTHNFDVVQTGSTEAIYVGGKEGIKAFTFRQGKWMPLGRTPWYAQGFGTGEVRAGNTIHRRFVVAIEPMHGNILRLYTGSDTASSVVLTRAMHQGHALAAVDILDQGIAQVLAGWREPDQDNKTGIKMYVFKKDDLKQWDTYWIDEGGMACEDLQVWDLDGDGKKDIIACGRASRNLKIYWNESRK